MSQYFMRCQREDVPAVRRDESLRFHPARLEAVGDAARHRAERAQAQANRWVSVGKLTLGADAMHLGLDKLVEAFPRTAGWVILVAALFVAANAAILWLRFH